MIVEPQAVIQSSFDKSRLLSVCLLLTLVAGCASSNHSETTRSTSERPPVERATIAPKGAGDVFGTAKGSAELDTDPAPTTNAEAKSDGGYKALSQSVRSGNVKAVNEETARILTSNPNDAVALNALALMYIRRGKPGAAKIVLNRALEKNTGAAGLYNNLGVILLDEGDSGAAAVQFKKALKADPNHVEANGNLGSLYASGADFQRARSLLELAHKANRNNASVANNYAIALRVAQDFEGSKRIYEDLLQKNNRDTAVLLNYATLLIDYMNKPKEGLEIVAKLQFLDSDKKDVQDRVIALEKKARAGVK